MLSAHQTQNLGIVESRPWRRRWAVRSKARRIRSATAHATLGQGPVRIAAGVVNLLRAPGALCMCLYKVLSQTAYRLLGSACRGAASMAAVSPALKARCQFPHLVSLPLSVDTRGVPFQDSNVVRQMQYGMLVTTPVTRPNIVGSVTVSFLALRSRDCSHAARGQWPKPRLSDRGVTGVGESQWSSAHYVGVAVRRAGGTPPSPSL